MLQAIKAPPVPQDCAVTQVPRAPWEVPRDHRAVWVPRVPQEPRVGLVKLGPQGPELAAQVPQGPQGPQGWMGPQGPRVYAATPDPRDLWVDPRDLRVREDSKGLWATQDPRACRATQDPRDLWADPLVPRVQKAQSRVHRVCRESEVPQVPLQL